LESGSVEETVRELMRIIIIITLILLVIVLAACADGKGDNGNISITESTDASLTSKTTIKIGNITDITGPAASGMELVNVALNDVINYYNENDVISGVEFEIVEWDGQFDPARTVPGYEWLQRQEVDFITTCAPGVATDLKDRLKADNMVLFTQMDEMAAIEPPGHVFSLACLPQHEAYTFMSWIAQNDWDYKKNGPAKIGAAAWRESYATGFVQAMEDYAEVHPEQFKFVEGYLPDFKFDWSSEIESLKECDYVFPPLLMHGFATNMRDAGSKAKLIGGTPHTALLKQVNKEGAWPAIEGMLFIFTGSWHGEPGKDGEFVNMMLNKYHPEEIEDILSNGASYIGVLTYRTMMQIVEKAVETTGPEGFNSESLYEAAQSWSSSSNERPGGYNYTLTKRYVLNDLGILEASAQQNDLVRNDPNWYPILNEP